MRDYVAWHDAYGEPGSPLWQRLQVVRSLIGAVLDAAPAVRSGSSACVPAAARWTAVARSGPCAFTP